MAVPTLIMDHTKHASLRGTLTTYILMATMAGAQTVSPAPAETERVVELSPFVISSSTGWIATETLAGSRLRTNFKDVPNQIETLTKDFMEDLAVTTIDQALIYTANVENKNDYMPATPGNAVSSPGDGGRFRGIGAGTLSRNFFQVHNPTDNFNLERATVASGPNAILFGLGSPAGILDATPARAGMRNKYGFSLQYDSEDSKRGTFDANVVVRRDQLAVRFMGMSKREYTMKRPNLDRDDRVYGALTFTPFKGTTLILQGERDHRSWNRAGRIAPTESVTPWLYANQVPGTRYNAPKPIYNNSTFTGIANNPIFNQAGEPPVLIQGGSVPLQSWRNSVVVRNPSTLPGVDPTFDASVNHTILDPAIFPFDVNIVGESRTTRMGGYTKTAMIEQRLARNLFLELAYNREDAYDHRFNAGGSAGSSDFGLNVDANQFIPGTTTPNPNVGKLYFQGGAGNDLDFYERDDWRVTLSYELDVAQKLAARFRFGKWLGRHRLSGLYTGSRNEYRGQQNFERKILDDPVIPGVTLRPRTFQNWATHATRVPVYRHYFDTPYDPTRAAGPMIGDWTLTDANGRPFTLALFDTPYRAADGKRLAAAQVAQGSLNQTTAQIFAWQGFFLPDREKRDRLVLTYGYRKDSAKSATLDNASQLQDFSGLFPVFWDANFADFGPTQSGINRNIGVVARPLKWLTLFYNKSTTFDLNIGRYDPFGNDIPGAGGDGKDYGIRLDLWKDRVTLRLNRYENSIGPQRASNQINQLRDIFFNLDTRFRVLDPTAPTINITDGNMRGYRVAGRPNYFIMSDSASEGHELELNLTPVRNWNIRLNGARTKAVESNIGLPWFEWAKQRVPVWEALVAKNGEVDAGGRPVTWQTAPYSATAPTGQTLQQYYNSSLVGRALAFMSAADGRSTDTARAGRANLITNYSFTSERLKGFNIGGAVRWRAEPTIGYGITTNAAGAVLLDIGQPYKGEPELYFDAIVGYRGKMTAFGGFNYRLQLNVRNLLDEDDVVPVTALTTGAIAKVATVEPRVIVVTFTVSF
jgi:outer membrane receptor protein involved in Fe transport